MPIQWGQPQWEPSDQWYARRVDIHFEANPSRLRQYDKLVGNETYMEYIKDFILEGPSPARYTIHGEGYRHHFIPQFVLRPFSTNDKQNLVGCVSLKDNDTKKISLREAATERGLYDVVIDDGSQSDMFEALLAQVEQKSSSPYKKLQTLRTGQLDRTYNGWDRLLIARLMAWQVVRTPKYRHRVRSLVEDLIALEQHLKAGLPPSGEASGKKSGIYLSETRIGNKQTITQLSFLSEVMYTIERNIFAFNWEVINFKNVRLSIGDNGILYGDRNAFGNYRFYAMPIAPDKLWIAAAMNSKYTSLRSERFVTYHICNSAHKEIYCHPQDINFWEKVIQEYKQFRQRQFGLMLP